MSIINIINSVVPRETSQVLQLTHLLEKCVAKGSSTEIQSSETWIQAEKESKLDPLSATESHCR